MKTYKVFQQQRPVATGKDIAYVDSKGNKLSGKEFNSNIIHVGEVKAYSGSHAIDVARKTMDCFKRAHRSTLAAFPIVELYYTPSVFEH